VVSNPACAGPTPADFCTPGCQPTPPLRATVTSVHGMSGMRVPFLEPQGIHGYNVPNNLLPFDYNLFQINQVGWFFATEGRELRDDPCLASHTDPCTFIP